VDGKESELALARTILTLGTAAVLAIACAPATSQGGHRLPAPDPVTGERPVPAAHGVVADAGQTIGGHRQRNATTAIRLRH
jgi:hypothetical protein